MSGPNDDLYAWVAAAALAAGVTAEELAESSAPPKCFTCRGPQVRRLGCLCDKCEARETEREHAIALRAAWDTLPESVRWVDITDVKAMVKLHEWVKDKDAINQVAGIAKDFRSHKVVTFTGLAGAGKTTLACLLLREWFRAGQKRKAPWKDYEIAKNSRFSTAMDLLQDRAETRLGDRVQSLDLAENAGCLLLDEVGRGRDIHHVIFGLIHKRLRDSMPTIFTTPCQSVDELGDATGDRGLARRLFDGATVVHVRKL